MRFVSRVRRHQEAINLDDHDLPQLGSMVHVVVNDLNGECCVTPCVMAPSKESAASAVQRRKEIPLVQRHGEGLPQLECAVGIAALSACSATMRRGLLTNPRLRLGDGCKIVHLRKRREVPKSVAALGSRNGNQVSPSRVIARTSGRRAHGRQQTRSEVSLDKHRTSLSQLAFATTHQRQPTTARVRLHGR